DIELGGVVRHPVLQRRRVDGNLLSIAGQTETKKVSTFETGLCRANQERALVLGPKRPATHETDPAWCNRIFPAELRIVVMRTRQSEQTGERVGRRVCNKTRRPAQLLQRGPEHRRLDRLELGDASRRTHDLHPPVVRAWLDPIDFIEGVIAIFLIPKRAADRIECEPEAVADAVREYFLDIRARLPADLRASGEEWIVRRRAPIVVQSEDHTGEMVVVGLRAPELIVGRRRCRAFDEILQLAASPVVPD